MRVSKALLIARGRFYDTLITSPTLRQPVGVGSGPRPVGCARNPSSKGVSSTWCSRYGF